MVAREPNPTLRLANIRVPLDLSNRIERVSSALPRIGCPRFDDYGFKISTEIWMNFIHVADRLLYSFVLTQLIQVIRVLLVVISLKYSACSGLAKRGMPNFEIFVRHPKSVQSFVLPVSATDLIGGTHSRTVVKIVDYVALARRPFWCHRDVPQDGVG